MEVQKTTASRLLRNAVCSAPVGVKGISQEKTKIENFQQFKAAWIS